MDHGAWIKKHETCNKNIAYLINLVKIKGRNLVSSKLANNQTCEKQLHPDHIEVYLHNFW